MARTQGRLLCTMWNQNDWRALTKDAQRLYMLLLGQSRLNLAGCIDLMLNRWVTLAVDDTPEELQTALDLLVERRYVAVDVTTSELVVRTLAKNDVSVGALNKNLIKGFWSAWIGIISSELRCVVVANTPDVMWDKQPSFVPAEATQTRRSLQFEPPSELPIEPPSEPQLPTTVPTSGSNLTTPSPSPSSTTVPTDPPPPTPTDPVDNRDDDDDPIVIEAQRRTNLEVARRAGTPNEITSPTAFAAHIATDLRRQGWTPPAAKTPTDDSRGTFLPGTGWVR